MTARLSEAERETALAALPDWRWDDQHDAIRRTFRFPDFSAAFGFMTRVALAAEKANHHPDWTNVWNCVDILLTTDSAKGLTVKDIALAREIDALVG